jgi:hypothetical protein
MGTDRPTPRASDPDPETSSIGVVATIGTTTIGITMIVPTTNSTAG